MTGHSLVRNTLACFGTVALFISQSAASFGQVPSAPSEAVANASRPGDLAISVFWIDNAVDEDGFEVQRCVGADYASFGTVYVSAFGNIGGFNNVGLAENTVYSYRVRAFNANGSSEFSNITSAKTSYAEPLQVTQLTAGYDGAEVHLSWIDVATNETRFEVERLEPGVSAEYEIIASLVPDTISYTDTTALAGTVYEYRVRPWRVDVFGGSEDPLSVSTGPGLAFVLSPIVRSTTTRSVELKWNGKFAPGTFVQIQRTDPEFGFFSIIALVNAKDRKYIDGDLPRQTFFTYRLRVVTDTAVSAWETVSASTK